MKKLSLYISIILISFSCNKSVNTETTFKEIMTAHDEVMPEMSDLRLLKDKIKALPDSLKTPEIIKAGEDLQKADDWMMDWMSNFEPSKKEELNYLNEQLIEVNKMKTFFTKSLNDAKQLPMD